MKARITTHKKTGVTTWDGTWLNGRPSGNIDVILKAAYDTAARGSFTCRKLTISDGSGLNIAQGDKVTVMGTLFQQGVGATLNVADGAQLVLLHKDVDVSTVKGTFRRTIKNLQRLDYFFFGSPISNVPLLNLSPNTDVGRFFRYDAGLFTPEVPSTVKFQPGYGWMIRTPPTHPATPADWNLSIDNLTAGTLNKGVITRSFQNFNTVFLLISNPYAANLNLKRFFEANKQWIRNRWDIWHCTNGGGGNTYLNGNSDVLTRYFQDVNIPPFQGFMAVLKDVTALNKIVFTPDMQLPSPNFSTPDRFALSILKEGVNLPLDSAVFDVKKFARPWLDKLQVTCLGIADSSNYTIKEGLQLYDGLSIALYVRTPTAGNYTIKLDSYFGRFADYNIMLLDNTTGLLHNLKTAPLTFAGAAATTYTGRFTIKITI